MTVLDRVPAEAIMARAQSVHLGRVLLGWLKTAATMFGGLLYLLGLSIRKAAIFARRVVFAIGFAFVWMGAAVVEGWADGARQEHEG